jgi:hypothetical protein
MAAYGLVCTGPLCSGTTIESLLCSPSGMRGQPPGDCSHHSCGPPSQVECVIAGYERLDTSSGGPARLEHLGRDCSGHDDFPAVDEVLRTDVLESASHVPEKFASSSRFQAREAPTCHAERSVLFNELPQTGLM